MRKPCIIVLGSAAAIPYPTRFAPSILVMGLRESILIDVGEGAQIRMHEVGVSPCRLKAIMVTHMHGDHFLGLFPLMQTMVMQSCGPVVVIAPSKSLCDVVKDYPCVSDCITAIHGEPITTMDFVITPVRMDHGAIEAYGYHLAIQADAKGRKMIRVFYGGDGVCREECVELLKQLGVDIVIHDSSFLSMDVDKAIASGHATTLDAAKLALEVRAKLLVLTHLSARYTDMRSVASDAYRLFPNVVVARDLMVVPIHAYL